MATTKFPEMKWCFAPIKNHLLVIYYPLSVSQSAHFHQSVSTHTLIQFKFTNKKSKPQISTKNCHCVPLPLWLILSSLCLVDCLGDVSDDVLNCLNADTQPDEARGDSGRGLLLGVELTVSGTRRMDGKSLAVADVCDVTD